jgi:hypothetical protein
MESRRFEVLPGSVGNPLATMSGCRYALQRGGHLDARDGWCDAPECQKPDDGKYGRQPRILLNINASCTNFPLDSPDLGCPASSSYRVCELGSGSRGAGPERPSLTGYATPRGCVVTRRYCRCRPRKGEAKN